MAKGVKMGCTLWVVTLLVLALITASPSNAVMQCNDAMQRILACQTFVMGGATRPSAQCCAGAQYLDSIAAASQPDRQAICECFKSAAQSLPVNVGKARELPELCNLDSGITIDPNVDCSKKSSEKLANGINLEEVIIGE
ncbi:hypothetical protein RJ639_030926 [Escallonia herrerae]|uniref:Bifunctional inhibitor/plant lipid transfer protein/seed storage helical domain-containing protein n=1 Tax=Escallonia herrerae TaxID=1293975 RepID=A0AA89BMI3_9ASTE|nr:hypothetical protein RJ639_030926 [Escallonia herrerae]